MVLPASEHGIKEFGEDYLTKCKNVAVTTSTATTALCATTTFKERNPVGRKNIITLSVAFRDSRVTSVC